MALIYFYSLGKIMKKLILASLILLPIASEAHEYYVKLNAGMGFVPKQSSSVVASKLKNTNNFIASFGVGKYLNEHVRLELALMSGAEIIPNSSGAVNINIPQFKDAAEKHKISHRNLMFKIEPDIVDFGYGKIFFSGGVGIAQLSDRVTVSIDSAGATKLYKAKSKDKINPSILAGIGASMFISDSVNIDLLYNFLYSGQTKSSSIEIDGKKISTNKMTIRSNNISVGLRYSF